MVCRYLEKLGRLCGMNGWMRTSILRNKNMKKHRPNLRIGYLGRLKDEERMV